MTVGVQLSRGNSAPNSGNNHHLTIPFEVGKQSFTRQVRVYGGGLKVRIYRVCVYRGNWRYGFTGCVCIGGTEGTDIQGACVSGELKVRIYRVRVYRGNWRYGYAGCVWIPELKARIRTTIETITADMLQTVWNELDYRVDVCRITKGAHIEHL